MDRLEELTSAYEAILRTNSDRLDKAKKELQDRDEPLFKNVIQLCQNLLTVTVRHTQESLQITADKVLIDAEELSSTLKVKIRQTEIRAAEISDFDIVVKSDGETIWVNGQQFGLDSQASVLPAVVKVWKTNVEMRSIRRVDFGLGGLFADRLNQQ